MEQETEILVKLNKIEKQNEQIKKRLWWTNFFAALRLVIIIAPIILGIIYLPSIIKNLLEKYNVITSQMKLENTDLNLPQFNNLNDLFSK
ncbi:hypothetical protein FJ208_00425 [Candidatus Gribaldobacteria bacterium]|nr:hypothetical protein [Candidatus Gribaldobacteria bacterium]